LEWPFNGANGQIPGESHDLGSCCYLSDPSFLFETQAMPDTCGDSFHIVFRLGTFTPA
jgi:hypothetical protein